LGEIADKYSLEQSSIALSFVSQQSFCGNFRTSHRGFGCPNRIVEVGSLSCCLIEKSGSAKVCTLVVSKYPVLLNHFVPSVQRDIVPHQTARRIYERRFLPTVYILCPLKIFRIFGDVVQPHREDSSRGVGAGVLAIRSVTFPGYSSS